MLKMNSIDLSAIINILLILAFIIDRVFRLKSVKEYKEAKEAQIENLKQQLELERKNNDLELADMHKKRYENLKLLTQERDEEFEASKKILLKMQSSLKKATKEVDLKAQLNDTLLTELNRLHRYKHDWDIEKKTLLSYSNPTEIKRIRHINN